MKRCGHVNVANLMCSAVVLNFIINVARFHLRFVVELDPILKGRESEDNLKHPDVVCY